MCTEQYPEYRSTSKEMYDFPSALLMGKGPHKSALMHSPGTEGIRLASRGWSFAIIFEVIQSAHVVKVRFERVKPYFPESAIETIVAGEIWASFMCASCSVIEVLAGWTLNADSARFDLIVIRPP